MRRSQRKRQSQPTRRSRLRAIPWAALLQVSMVLRNRWMSLSAKDRARLTEILRESQGRLGNLSSRQRDDLRKLVGKLDLKRTAGELAPIMRGGGKGKRR